MKLILLDIEGTTTPIDFVHKVLFPYSNDRIAEFILEHKDKPVVQESIALAIQTMSAENNIKVDKSANLNDIVAEFKKWIKEDRKHPALKTIQGLLWEQGYVKKEIFGEVYDDVPIAFQNWKNKNIQMGIYSSGSVLAQKLLFKHSKHNDLTPFLSFHFDTAVGAKREVTSYKNILDKIQMNAKDVLFLSDIGDELAAANAAGMSVFQIVRPGTMHDERFEEKKDLLQINLNAY